MIFPVDNVIQPSNNWVLEVKKWLLMNWRVFIAVLGEELLQNNQISAVIMKYLYCCCIVTNMAQFFCFMQKKAPIMQRMQTLANYADLHHRILSDALTMDDSVQ